VEEPLVLEQTHGDVALIGINRPHVRNCVNLATGAALRSALERFDADDGLKSAVLHGVGGNFCAGFDLSELATLDVDTAKKEEDDSEATTLEATFAQRAIADPLFRPMGPSKMWLNKPLIGAISGYAVAGGLELALLCDVRIVEENAIFGVFCRRFGVPLIDGGTVRLGAIIGYGRAMEMILTGRPVKAKEALAWGLANDVVLTGTALGGALNFARSLSKFPQQCLRADRRSLFYATFEAPSFDAAMDNEYFQGLPIVEAEAVQGAARFAGEEKVGRGASFHLDGPKEKGAKRTKRASKTTRDNKE